LDLFTFSKGKGEIFLGDPLGELKLDIRITKNKEMTKGRHQPTLVAMGKEN
jgi:hypothetical protein